MVIRETEQTVICLHKEDIVGTIGTCKLCGQKRQYDFTNTKDPPKVIKRGRINGLLTDIIPMLGSKPIETTAPEPEPATEPSPLAETVEKAEVQRMGRPSKYDKHIEDILSDYEQMTVVDLQKKWSMHRGYFYLLKRRWEARGINIPTAYADRETTPEAVDERAAKQGRLRTGKYFKCVDCGKRIYVRKYRLDQKPDAEHRCKKCASKHYIPPPKKAEPGLKKAFRRIVKEDIEISCDVAMDLLAKYLKHEPEATVKALIGDAHKPFSAMQLQEAAFGLYVEVLLDESDEFEKVGEDLYKVRQ